MWVVSCALCSLYRGGSFWELILRTPICAASLHLAFFSHSVLLQDQYKICFEILQSYLDSFDTYANFKAVWEMFGTVYRLCNVWTSQLRVRVCSFVSSGLHISVYVMRKPQTCANLHSVYGFQNFWDIYVYHCSTDRNLEWQSHY